MMSAGYMADGMRAWKQPSTGSKTYFIYDGDDPVVEMDASGSVQAVNTFYGGPVSRHTPAGSTFYTFDALGNVSQQLNAGQSVVSSDWYDAYGSRHSTGPISDPFGYKAASGYYSDTETGLIYLQHRYYDPGVGRFLNRDPISYAGGINIYGYAGNNPVNFDDPEGLSWYGDAWHSTTRWVTRFGRSQAKPGSLGRQAASMGVDSVPVVGNAKALQEAITGCDYIAGHRLSTGERWMSLVFVIPFANDGRAAEKGAVEVGENLVYRSVNEAGKTNYVGITRDFEQRAAAHLRTKDITIRPIPGLGNLSRDDARAVEQALIEHHGLGKNGGSLLNKINSIAKSNPIYPGAIDRGTGLLKRAGYPGF